VSGGNDPDHVGLIRERNIYQSPHLLSNRKTQERERPMTRLSLAILGIAAILTSAAGPAMAKGNMAQGAKDKQANCVGSNCQIKGSKALAKNQSHMQRHAANRGERFRSTNAALTREDRYRRPVGPVDAAGAVVGGAVATAGAIATAPFRAFDGNYNDYYGYGYGGRDWKTYATRNGLACTPGATFAGADGRQHPCQ
jgi:hypothetical protein